MKNLHNEKRAVQLGMSFGKARNILINMIFLNLAKKCGESACFKCGKEISFANEISIEHKKRWLDVSPDLFWDLENIAFSHRKCNTPDRTGGTRKICPPGTSWCGKCKSFKPLDEFHKSASRRVGVHFHCKICRLRGKKNSGKAPKSECRSGL
jgi:hypothetical protein